MKWCSWFRRPIGDKSHPRFIAGYDAGLRDGLRERANAVTTALEYEAMLAELRAELKKERETHGTI